MYKIKLYTLQLPCKFRASLFLFVRGRFSMIHHNFQLSEVEDSVGFAGKDFRNKDL